MSASCISDVFLIFNSVEVVFLWVNFQPLIDGSPIISLINRQDKNELEVMATNRSSLEITPNQKVIKAQRNSS